MDGPKYRSQFRSSFNHSKTHSFHWHKNDITEKSENVYILDFCIRLTKYKNVSVFGIILARIFLVVHSDMKQNLPH